MKHIIALLLICLPFGAAQPQQFSGFKLDIAPLPGLVNSAADDYAPVILPRSMTLYFTSYRDLNSQGEADMYYSRAENNTWTAAVNAGAPFNTSDNDGSITFSAEGTIAVFATDGREDGFGDTDLYMVQYSDGNIVSITNPGAEVNSEYWDSQPTLTADGRTLYFVSNRPGGFGGTDIWTATQDGWGKWSAAHILGQEINTGAEERSPSVSPDGKTLYFSSNGFPGYGELDIWMSSADNTGWSLPQNLGPQINSAGNDMFFHMHAENERFYFASDRGGGLGGLDVYMGTPDIFSSGFFYLTVQVIDSTSGNPLPASVSVLDVEQNRIVLSWETDMQTDFYTNLLPAGRDYIVRASSGSNQNGEVRVTAPASGGKERAVIRFGPLTAAEFDLGRFNIPFFVSGYYRPNTSAELEQLFDRRKGDLRRATYIESFKRNSDRHRQYTAYAASVESIFETVRLEAVNNVFPHLMEGGQMSDTLVIVVTGYADPHPIIGRYLEGEDVTFLDLDGAEHTVREGAVMTNLNLSGLRAWHSSRYLDLLFRGSGKSGELYRQLLDQGRIRYRVIGGDVQRDTRNHDMQRRIHILMEVSTMRSRGTDDGGTFDLNKQLRRGQ